MKVLIDEMFPAGVVAAMREKHGVDAVSVRERRDLVGRPDAEVFAAGQLEGWAVVTENVRDFRAIAREFEGEGEVHFGLILTSNRRFPRSRPGTMGRLIAALAKVAKEAASEEPSNLELWL